MNATLHRILMTIGGVAAGVGGLIALPEWSVLGIPESVGAAISLGAALVILIANTIRANFPDEPPAP